MGDAQPVLVGIPPSSQCNARFGLESRGELGSRSAEAMCWEIFLMLSLGHGAGDAIFALLTGVGVAATGGRFTAAGEPGDGGVSCG